VGLGLAIACFDHFTGLLDSFLELLDLFIEFLTERERERGRERE